MNNIFSFLKNRICSKLRYELGITKLEEEKESLLFLFNHCLDITNMPPTKDCDLRILQKCDTILLAIFDKLCNKYNLKYWLDYGTLLGAFRHNGFIPWDDDIDVSMPRQDYDKIRDVLEKELSDFGFQVRYSDIHPLRGLILLYGDGKTGVWLDIFPVDNCRTSDNYESIIPIIKQYRDFFWKNRTLEAKELTVYKNELLKSVLPGDNLFLLPIFETWKGNKQYIVHKEGTVFPLKRHTFENFSLSVPNCINQYLENLYGEKYMEFPRCAINTHGQDGDLPMSKRAKANGIDMNELYLKLNNVYEEIQ